MYYKPDTRQVFTDHNQIRNTLMYILFPSEIDDEMLEYHGVFKLENAPPQAEATQVARPSGVEEIEGVWHLTYVVEDATEEELQAMKPAVPVSVTRRQARQALLIRGWLKQVPILLESIEDEMQRELAKIEWEDSLDFERNRPLVAQIGLALGLDEEGLDELFIFASTL